VSVLIKKRRGEDSAVQNHRSGGAKSDRSRSWGDSSEIFLWLLGEKSGKKRYEVRSENNRGTWISTGRDEAKKNKSYAGNAFL